MPRPPRELPPPLRELPPLLLRPLDREPPLDRPADELLPELRFTPEEPELRDRLDPSPLDPLDRLLREGEYAEPELRDRLDPIPLDPLERLLPEGDCKLRPEPREEPELAPGI